MILMLIQANPQQPEQDEAQSASDLASSIAPFLLLAGVVMLTIVLMGKIKKKTKRSSREPVLEPKERIEAIREKADSGTVLQHRAAETTELIRELTALLDNRSEKLELLVQHADERISRLERLSDEAEQRLTPRHAENRNSTEKPRSESTLATDALRQQIYDLADQGHATNEIAQRLGQHVGKVELILALRRA
jgi:hypothetical protein